MSLFTFSILLSSAVSAAWCDYVQTSTRYGAVRGRRVRSPHDVGGMTRIIDQYLGMPYAASPIGDLRFQPPEDPRPWSGVRNCTRMRPVCIQVVRDKFLPVTSRENQNESCLFLNIYSPYEMNKTQTMYPVMVFIHGGSYLIGTGNMYDGTYLAQNGVVVVTLNYRLGILGFYSTGNELLPGNYGFLDQVQALRWVQQNIAAFRGDPENVTIFGNSVGGASTGLHMVSPLSRGLFHRAIAQSGSVISDYAILEKGVDVGDFPRRLALRCGCPAGGDEAAMVECMRKTPARIFAIHLAPFSTENPIVILLMPRVDGYAFSENPRVSFSAGRFVEVPLMTGTVSDEWASNIGWFVHAARRNRSHLLDFQYDDGMDRHTFLATIQHIVGKIYKFPKSVADVVVHSYTDWENATNPVSNRDKYLQLMTDLIMVAPCVRLADFVSRQNLPVYMYQFSYLSATRNPWGEAWRGVYHTMELNYLFGSPFSGVNVAQVSVQNYTEADRMMSRTMMQMWAAFAIHGAPNLPREDNTNLWREYSNTTRRYLSIANKGISARTHLRAQQMALWLDLVPSLARDHPACAQSDEGVTCLLTWVLLGVCTSLLIVTLLLSVITLKRKRCISVSIHH